MLKHSKIVAVATRQPVIYCALSAIVLSTIAVYLPLLNADFIDFDDSLAILDNTMIHDGLTIRGIKWAFSTTYYDYWHPLTWVSHMLDISLFGLNAGGHHLTNILLHTACVLGVFFCYACLV